MTEHTTGNRATAVPRRLIDPADAAAVLVAGGLVGLPTETVYGLAADAGNPAAVRRVFDVKGRPPDHPLIVHLADARHLPVWVAAVAPQLLALAEQHWPGPLTIVVPKASWVPSSITGGQATVAIRVPGNPLTREVIRLFGAAMGDDAAGVVAPSANVFGQVSPTTAEHVRCGLGDRLTARDAILDGGPCQVGVESTIVAWVAGQVRVLRPGAVRIGGPETSPESSAPLAGSDGGAGPGETTPRVPGSLSSHYAPNARVVLVADTAGLAAAAAGAGAGGAVGDTDTGLAAHVGLLAPTTVTTPAGWLRLAAPPDPAAYARVLYDALRRADEAGLAVVVAVPPSGTGALAEAVMDRLTRAAAVAAR